MREQPDRTDAADARARWQRTLLWRALFDFELEDAERDRRARVFISVLVPCLLLSLVGIVSIPFLEGGDASQQPIQIGALLVLSLSYVLSILAAQRGHVDVAAMATGLILTAGQCPRTVLGGEFDPTMWAALVATVTVALGLTPARIWLLYTLRSMLLVGVVLWIAQDGVDAMERSKIISFFSLDFTITLIMWVTARQLQLSFRQAREAREQVEVATQREHALRVEAEQSREQAEAASRAKSNFLAVMSHELRTPLNAIIGYAEIVIEDIEDDLLDEEAAAKDLRRVRRAGKHLLALISDVLDISRIEAGRMELEFETFAIGELIDEVVETARPLVEERANALRVEVAEDAATMRSDRVRVRQVLLNLLSNAAKFTRDGVVTLRAEQVKEGARLSTRFVIEDTGIGMSPEVQARVFEAFVQADARTTREYGGTGLGLALCKRFCEVLGGSIEVESAVGEGSTFTVSLPSLRAPEITREVELTADLRASLLAEPSSWSEEDSAEDADASS